MIKITPKTLIIEIPCLSQQPLSLLSDITTGINNLIGVASLAIKDAPDEWLANGLYHTANLLKNMTITIDQAAVLNEALTEKEEKEFNSWARVEASTD